MKIILIIDDLETNLFLCTKVLERYIEKTAEDYVIMTADSGMKAIDMYQELKSSNHEVSCVICDFNMPGLLGTEVCHEFRKLGYHGLFNMLTANDRLTIDQLPCANAIFYKPLTKEMIPKFFVAQHDNFCKRCDKIYSEKI